MKQCRSLTLTGPICVGTIALLASLLGQPGSASTVSVEWVRESNGQQGGMVDPSNPSGRPAPISASVTWKAVPVNFPLVDGSFGFMMQEVSIARKDVVCNDPPVLPIYLSNPLSINPYFTCLPGGTGEMTFYEYWWLSVDPDTGTFREEDFDTFSSPELTADGLYYIKVGRAKFIPSAQIDLMDGFPSDAFETQHGGHKKGVGNVVYDPNDDMPNDEHSGGFPSTRIKPSMQGKDVNGVTTTLDWDNNFGGHAIDLAPHHLSIHWLYCPVAGGFLDIQVSP